jgi:hypothetical protein
MVCHVTFCMYACLAARPQNASVVYRQIGHFGERPSPDECMDLIRPPTHQGVGIGRSRDLKWFMNIRDVKSRELSCFKTVLRQCFDCLGLGLGPWCLGLGLGAWCLGLCLGLGSCCLGETAELIHCIILSLTVLCLY